MASETRTCQNCKQSFVIEPDDFTFYERIKVPAPTFCPHCRMVRRMTWRNERELYRRKCGLTGKDIISGFSSESGITVYDRDVWWSDNWDPLTYSRDYNFSQPFFKQYRELLGAVPMPNMFTSRATNSDYCQHSGELKDCYLLHATWQGERSMYGARLYEAQDSMDLLAATDCELSYEIIASLKMYHTLFAQDSEACSNSLFIFQCKGCESCFGCTNLRNKNYHFFNQPCTKEEYETKLKDLDLGSFHKLEEIKARFAEERKKSLRKFANLTKTENCTGDNISNASNCKECFDFRDEIRDCKFDVNGGFGVSDLYDGYGVGAQSELIYEAVDSGASAQRLLFDIFVWGGVDVNYCYACHGSQNLFACIGLRNKQYCILNKQYSKQEYEALVPKIIEHMNTMPYVDSKGRVYKYGEFFPPELFPFAYNETIAQEYFPLTKEEALSQGYSWKDPETKQYTITMTVDRLPDHIKDVDDSILNETIQCAHASPNPSGEAPDPKCNHQCTTAFKIIPQELQFYRRMSALGGSASGGNLPLPRLCPNCRHYERLSQRNPPKLWPRTCQCAGQKSENGVYNNSITHFHNGEHCPNEFQTSYAPERPEIVYCESCYNSEVV